MQYLKVEVLIPKLYNNGTKIEAKKHRETYREIRQQFNGCTEDKSPLVGEWINPLSKEKFKDQNFSYWVLCIDNIGNMKYLEELKERLKSRYDQDEILMYYTSVTSDSKIL